MKQKKFLILALSLAIPFTSMWGIDVYFYNDGALVSSVSDVRKIVLNEQNIDLVLYSGSQSTVDATNIDFFTFSRNSVAKVDVPSSANEPISISLNGNVLYVSANSNIDKVEVYSFGGQKMLTSPCGTSNASVSLGSIPDGAYVVKVLAGHDTRVSKIIKH